jgi:L-malate glycosyltransferase
MEPLKILHISTARTWRGGEQQLAYLLRELGAMGVECHVVCNPDSPMHSHCKTTGAPSIGVRTRVGADPLAAFQLARYAHRVDPDVVHTHDSRAHTMAVLATTLWGMHTPLIVSRRVDFPIGGGLSAKYKYGHPAVRRILCVSSAINAITAAGLKNTSVLRTVHSGIDIDRFSQGADGRLRKMLELAEHDVLVGNVGALAPHKDLFTFIHAAHLVSLAHPHTRFVLVGDGELRSTLKAEVARLGLNEVIHFVGFRTDVHRILPELDIMLMTSRTEGLGTTVLDAFAAAVPVVATMAGGIPEIVEHERTGLLCAVGDAVALAQAVGRILTDEALRHHIVSSAYERAKHFSARVTAEKTLAEYYAVLAEERTGKNTNSA